MTLPRQLRATLLVAVVVGIALGTIGTAIPIATAEESEVGGAVVVEEGETVDEIEAVAGNVVVHGTVTGDVSALSGNVQIHGDVGGDVEVAAGNIELTGSVDGDVSGASGSIVVAEGATIGGSLEGGAGTVTIDGTIEGDASVGAETVQLGENAAIDGDLRYGGTLGGNTDAVAGEITQESSFGPLTETPLQPFTEWIVAVYAFFLNLLLGAFLLALFPRFSDSVATRVASSPVRTGLAGLGILVGIPIVLVAIAITIIGIPITVVGSFLFVLLVWIGIIYGRFAVAAWLLSYADITNRWLALVVGLLGGALLSQIPWIGGLLNLVIFLLGLGALSIGLYASRRRRREAGVPAQPGGPAAD